MTIVGHSAKQPPLSEPRRPESAATGTTGKAYGDRNFKPANLPGLGSGKILPVWLSDRLNRLFARATPH